METAQNTGAQVISKSFMTDKQLSLESKAIYMLLLAYSRGTKQAWPSIKTMAADLKTSRTRIQKHILPLINQGHISVTRCKTTTKWFNSYSIHDVSKQVRTTRYTKNIKKRVWDYTNETSKQLNDFMMAYFKPYLVNHGKVRG